MNYSENRLWSDRFIPDIKKIIGPLLLGESTFEVDTKEATDLVIMHTRDLHIAARVRRYGFSDKYPFDFTIRSRSKNGQKTELSKIVDGMADWMFYGHADFNNKSISRWMVLNLDSFRAALIRKQVNIPREIPNSDGTKFVTFDVMKFPENLIIACCDDFFSDKAA